MTGEDLVVRLAARGDGVTASGRYVADVAPGDIVTEAGVRSGPHRRTPPCVHFGRCGGCQLQHIDDVALAGFVQGRAIGALAAAGIVPGEVHAVHLSPRGARRRASLRALYVEGTLRMGFNVERGPTVVDLTECHVVTPALWRSIAALRGLMPVILGRREAAVLALTETTSGIDISVSGISVPGTALAAMAAFAEAHQIARISGEEGVLLQRATPALAIDGVLVELPPGAFLQATADAERALQRAVVAACLGATKVADLFCGVGTFALPLARSARVTAIDASGPAVTALAAAASASGRKIDIDHRDLFRRPLDSKALARFDVVVLDPPRAGAADQIKQLAASKISRICYVSCNPNTFARDARVLVEAGFRLAELWPVGQFRWSLQVELAALFVR